ncbi:MAG TPA: phenylacetaldoxime dehydratase family protein [Amycolatopsis sp.]|uniref:phenylacetaldoxime dehydratase family protein n=1 Tax=Amycolatopsis sp. TaxID=37632 RepID=UPI002B494748|nr:phenylacetaldoxime dehydratase family protein [Amycolatopsis sp.]HKS45826.1 phenylacetaldoxime dehydratase family protein [Amycolatopsis sp.]
MEPAIPAHLVQERTQPSSLRPNWEPRAAAFVARFAPRVRQMVMAYFGVQYRQPDEPALVGGALATLSDRCAATDGPEHVDRAVYTDEAGYRTVLTIAYWEDPARFDRWFVDARAAWLDERNSSDEAGFFVEVVRPTTSRFETLFSSNRREGVAHLSEKFSGPVAEHEYWGGARDRIPLAQTDPLDAGEPPVASGDRRRRVVRGQHNLCLIRSGQDWTDTDDDERRMYLEDIEPTLRAGMEFLRDDGLSVGCFANRYVRLLGEDGNPVDKTFGMSWWRTLEDLDTWAREHPTHLSIFGKALKHLSTLGPKVRLRLYHEVTVAAAEEQYFEYLGCHPDTGMLRAVGESEQTPVSVSS